MGSTLRIFFDKRTKPGMNTGADPVPFNRKPKIIKIIFCGIGGQGYINIALNEENIKPIMYIKYTPNFEDNASKN